MIHKYEAATPTWMRQIEHLPPGCHGAKGGPLCDGMDLATQAYGVLMGSHAQFTAFAYLWRRFGPPWIGGDPHKDLVSYVLGTPYPGIMLTMGLSASPLPYAVGYLITREFQDTLIAARRTWECQFQDWWIATQATEEERALMGGRNRLHASAVEPRYMDARMDDTIVTAAIATIGRPPSHYSDAARTEVQGYLLEALTELLRPVFIRDVAINVLGRVADTDLDDERDVADASPYAGSGVPQDAMNALVRREE